jgi:hypothetical protein
MREVVERVVLSASPLVVWSFVTAPDNFAEYVDGYDRGRVASTNSTGLGARYEWYARLGPARLRSDEEVVEWTEGSFVRYSGSMAGVRFWSAMHVRPAGPEATDFTVWVRFRAPSWIGGGLVERLIVEPTVRASVRRSLDKLTLRYGSHDT